jgi:hypothetical protein
MRAHRFLGVAAAVMSFAVVGASGAAASGVSVGAAKQIPHALTLFDLSCPPGRAVTHSVCGIALQTDFNPYGMSLIKDGVPEPARVVPPNGIHIACPTTTTCVLADRGGIGWVVNDQSVSITPLGGMDVLNAIACSSASRCIAVGNSGNADHQRAVIAVVTRGASVANARRVAGATYLEDVSCVGSTRCVAVGAVGQPSGTQHAVVVPIINDKPQAVHRASTLTTFASVSCGTSSSCFGTGNSIVAGAFRSYVVPIANGTPRTPVPDPAGVTDLSCWNATDCLGVNSHAAARFHRGHVVGTKRIRAPQPVQLVACPTSAGCLVAGGSYAGKQQVAVVRP